MGRKGVVPHRLAGDFPALDLENHKTPAAAEMPGNGRAVFGSNCDFHTLFSLC